MVVPSQGLCGVCSELFGSKCEWCIVLYCTQFWGAAQAKPKPSGHSRTASSSISFSLS